MSRNYKFHNPDGIYFVSFAVVDWMDVFTRKEYKEILLDSLNYCQQNRDMEIFAWCIMSNHVHLVFRIAGDLRPEEVLGRFKQFTSRRLVRAIKTNPKESRRKQFLASFKNAAIRTSNTRHYQFWRHDNRPIELWSNTVIRQKICYIHQNPVKSGLVLNPEDYLYSSARDYSGERGLLDVIVVG